MDKVKNEKVIKFPSDRQRNPDDYARTCPHCGGITYVLTLSNRLKCFECDEFLTVDEIR